MRFVTGCAFVLLSMLSRADQAPSSFFEAKIRPVLVEHCYSCHSAEAKKLKGGLRLDLKKGWETGGDSGKPAIIPGDASHSPLLLAMQHVSGVEPMPPRKPKLPAAILQDFSQWINQGAFDPRTNETQTTPSQGSWAEVYRERLQWWSLQHRSKPKPPAVRNRDWPRNSIDRFILAGLESKGLDPAPEADRPTLARRLSLVLTGLPPSPEIVESFVADPSPGAYETLVGSLLESPHFGERWARHWMDVVHYADTHGYEWDAPAKHAWKYRDYLVRAFNADIPFQRLILEQLAGDLIEPRVDPRTGLNEALIGPMAMRLGERRHGDNAAAEGVTQEAVANIIDTVSKGFLATTVACAQCHDHKLDAISQRDYYSLAGLFANTRWGARGLEARDPNTARIEELRGIKSRLRRELSRIWLDSKETLIGKIRNLPRDTATSTNRFPETLAEFWKRSNPVSAEELLREIQGRREANATNLTLIADFARPGAEAGWRWDGLGMKHGLVAHGEIVVADEGRPVVTQLLPAGRWSHVWSQRLAGALRSPLFDSGQHPPVTLSIGFAGGKHAARAFMIDQAFHSERMTFIQQPAFGWLTLKAGEFDTLEGGTDRFLRRVHLEIATKALNNYFPPRTAYGGLKEADLSDERSWFGASQIFSHPAGKPPRDTLARFAPLAQGEGGWDAKLAVLVRAAVTRWGSGRCDAEDVLLLNDALQAGLLPNDADAFPSLRALVDAYRACEKKIQPDQTIGSASDWEESTDERVGIRGSYTEFGEAVPRGNIGFLGGPAERSRRGSSGRLEFAHSIASADNPLTARVFVNRVWLHLFGEGLVRTPDDFGHLGERPSHPELLDHLADCFVAEGWSLKRLITLMVSSSTWRQSGQSRAESRVLDPENRLLHHYPMRRLDAESIRDAMLMVSGRLTPALQGPPIDPSRVAQDPAKRLFSGPVDGLGRRSLYTKITLMEPPRFLAIFNQPIPKLTTGKRDSTSVPDQALALLNDPLVLALAQHWGRRMVHDGAITPEQRAAAMFRAAFARSPKAEESTRLAALARRSASLRNSDPGGLMQCQPAWQDVAHALFNLKEFMYVF